MSLSKDVMGSEMHQFDSMIKLDAKGEKTKNATLKEFGDGPSYLDDHGSQAYLRIQDGKMAKDHKKIARTMMYNNDQR